MLAPWKKSSVKPRLCIKKSGRLLTKFHLVKAMVFSVVIYRCESWTRKKAECWRSNAFELWCWRSLESPLDCREIKSVNPKGNQSWIFIGRTDAEAEAPILCPPDAKNWFIRKDPDAGKDWRQKRMSEDEMVGQHHRLYGHEFEHRELVMDREAWCAFSHGVTKNWTCLSDWTEWNFLHQQKYLLNHKEQHSCCISNITP